MMPGDRDMARACVGDGGMGLHGHRLDGEGWAWLCKVCRGVCSFCHGW